MWKLNMAFVLLLCWGGFAWCIMKTMKAEESKNK
jgi:hypothetical protein